MRKILALLCGLTLSACPALAQNLSDGQITKMLIGNWVSAPRADQLPDHMLQVLRIDGSGTAYFFRDDSCKALLSKIDVRWRVENGVLITLYREGYSDHDAIIALTPGKLTLHSTERQKEIGKVKSTRCREPKA